MNALMQMLQMIMQMQTGMGGMGGLSSGFSSWSNQTSTLNSGWNQGSFGFGSGSGSLGFGSGNSNMPAQASIVGASSIAEGSSGSFKVKLDRAVTQDTWVTVKVNDGTAKRTSEANASNQEYWPNQRGASKTAQIGPDSLNKDFTVFDGQGKAQSTDTVRVLVKAGQTESEAFSVKAWSELQRGSQYGKATEQTEKFSMNVQSIGDQSASHCAPANPVSVNITDTYRSRVSPVALDLNGNGKIDTTGSTTARDPIGAPPSLGNTVRFDMAGNGQQNDIEWLKGTGDGLLVDTSKLGANNQINGKALFGDDSGTYASGYDKLAQLDANQDGQLTGQELDKLGVWIDDGDAKLEAGELKSVNELGISQLSVGHQQVQSAGGLLDQSSATQRGRTILTEDVWFGQK